ncbi:MAG TPA: BCCT family transporter, partial [Candidatus Blautia gallistercoris]|nr:BCCT family transporter [Candidatus Blautia gallistercoris]
FLAAVFLSFVTAADSTTIAMADLSTHGLSPENPDSPVRIKVAWAVVTAAIAMIMMNVGNGADGLKIITNIGGLPAALFLAFVTAAAIKVLFRPDLYRDSAEKSKKESPSD